MHCNRLHLFASACLLLSLSIQGFGQEVPPRSTDPRLKIELYAESPQVVTPTGIDVDHTGRVWVIESNTHFPPAEYKGHSTDRILVMEGTNKEGHVEKITVFKDGLIHTMSVAVKPVWLDLANIAGRTKNKEEFAVKVIDKSDRVVDQISEKTTSVFVATRREILLCLDTDGDLKCDESKQLVHLETTGNYPHNGLAGFAFDAQGQMYFGFGENLGADYILIGSDGTRLSGGGEGGNIYRCQPDGSRLERWATGFWNPHASCFDASGHLFSVDNDPDSRPPCRLLHIIPGGDYGYRFRNGRKGTHPFTAWNGEIPGTLPMVSGTGEAPSGIVCYESDGLPSDYIGNLFVGSWGDHRIDKFVLKPRGVSFESMPQPVIKGGENFRPVGLAVAPDGSMYVTDWVSKEYKLHGLGRVWRVSAKVEPVRKVIDAATMGIPVSRDQLYELSQSPRLDIRRIAALKAAVAGHHLDWCSEILEIDDQKNQHKDSRVTSELVGVHPDSHSDPAEFFKKPFAERWQLICELWGKNPDDPFNFSYGLWYFASGATTEEAILKQLREDSTRDIKTPPKRWTELMLGLTGRRNHPKSAAIAQWLTESNEPSSRRIGVQWIGEEYLGALRPQIDKVLASEPMSGELFMGCLASLSLLDRVPPSEFEKSPPTQHVLPIVLDTHRDSALRAIALRILPASLKELDRPLFSELLTSSDQGLRREAVRTLQFSGIPERAQLLRGIAADRSIEISLRADAVAGLAGRNAEGQPDASTRDLLIELAERDSEITIRVEAIRSLRGPITSETNTTDRDPRVTEMLKKLFANIQNEPQSDRRTLSEEIEFASGKKTMQSVPDILARFTQDHGHISAAEDSSLSRFAEASGRRAFFRVEGAGCYKCHSVGGRGGQVGPDLTVIARTMDRMKLAESILEPSKEISPQFTTWAIETISGKVINGLLLGEEVNGDLRLGNSQGEVVLVPFNEIETRTPMKTSIMPDNLHSRMSVTELHDLVAFLLTLK